MSPNSDNISHDESSSFMKYFRIFVFTSPVSNLRIHSQGLKRIFEELDKTKLPTANEFQNEITMERRNLLFKSIIITAFSIYGIFKFKGLSLLNRVFLTGVFSTGCFYLFGLQMKENVLAKLIQSQTHYGQEARILTKYFIPDHKQILNIQRNIEDFRDYITSKKKQIQSNKTNVEVMLRKESKLDQMFIEEISKELEKQENENIKTNKNI